MVSKKKTGHSKIILIFLFVLLLVGFFVIFFLLKKDDESSLTPSLSPTPTTVERDALEITYPENETEVILGQLVDIRIKAMDAKEVLLTSKDYAEAKNEGQDGVYSFSYEVSFNSEAKIDFIATAIYDDNSTFDTELTLFVKGSKDAPLSYISADVDSLTMQIGETYTLQVFEHLTTGYKRTIESKDVFFQTSIDRVGVDKRAGRAIRSVIEVSENGVVTALSEGYDVVIITHPEANAISIPVEVIL